jgi:hypothetical protein
MMTATDILRFQLGELRARRGKLAELARAAKVDPGNVSEWTNGKFNPSLDKLDAIAAVYGVTLSELFQVPGQAGTGHVPTPKGRRHGPSPLSRRCSKKDAARYLIDVALELVHPAARAEILTAVVSETFRTPPVESARRGVVRRDDRRPYAERGGFLISAGTDVATGQEGKPAKATKRAKKLPVPASTKKTGRLDAENAGVPDQRRLANLCELRGKFFSKHFPLSGARALRKALRI